MKQYVAPYLVSNADSWWAAIDIYNNNDHAIGCEATVYDHKSGMKLQSYPMSIGSFSHSLMLPDEVTGADSTGRCSVVIVGPSGLLITPFQGQTPTGFGYAPVSTLQFKSMVGKESRRKWEDKPWMMFHGNPQCQFDFAYQQDIVSAVAMSIYNDFPDRNDRVLRIGDACPMSGNCPNHPPMTHGVMTNFDINYYTTKTNNTQYEYGDAPEHTEMWKVAGEKLLRHVFDIDRNAELILRLKKYFPKMHAAMNDILYNLLLDYDVSLLGTLQEAQGTHYQHHTHIHIELK